MGSAKNRQLGFCVLKEVAGHNEAKRKTKKELQNPKLVHAHYLPVFKKSKGANE